MVASKVWDRYSGESQVAVFRTELLRISEVFINDQFTALRKYKPIYVGFKRAVEGVDLGVAPYVLVDPLTRSEFWFGLKAKRLLRLLKDHNVSLMHCHFATDASDIWPTLKAKGLPMLVTLHGYDITIRSEWWKAGRGGLRRRLYPYRLKAMAQAPNVYFVAVSSYIARRAIEFGIPEERVFVNNIGTRVEDLNGLIPIYKRRNQILFVGRMVEKKNPLLLLEAFMSISKDKDIVDSRLVMVGDGPLFDDCRHMIDGHGLDVEFTGALSAGRVRELIDESKVLCLPSVRASNGDAEGFGLVLLEAQARGVPVITSADGGAQEGLIDGVTGYRFSQGDQVALEKRLKELLSDDELLSHMSVNAREFVEKNFDIFKCTEQLEQIYDRILGKD